MPIVSLVFLTREIPLFLICRDIDKPNKCKIRIEALLKKFTEAEIVR